MPKLGLFIILYGCSEPSKTDDSPPLSVEVVIVSSGSVAKDDIFPARIAYDREAVLSPRVSGVIHAMPITLGQRLGDGALVLDLEPTQYRAMLAHSEADVRRATRDAERDSALVGAGAIAALDARDAADKAIAAGAARSAAAYDLASTRLKMPFPGVVLAKFVDVGATVLPGQAVATVADLRSPLIARAMVPLEMARNVAPGTPAKISAAGRSFGGNVLRVHSTADGVTNSVEVVVAITNPDAHFGLVSGAAGTVSFPSGAMKRTPVGDEQLIPTEALVDANEGKGQVYLVDTNSGFARLVTIRLLGPSDEGWRVSGLVVGSQVITSGAGFVKNGQRVSVVPQ